MSDKAALKGEAENASPNEAAFVRAMDLYSVVLDEKIRQMRQRNRRLVVFGLMQLLFAAGLVLLAFQVT